MFWKYLLKSKLTVLFITILLLVDCNHYSYREEINRLKSAKTRADTVMILAKEIGIDVYSNSKTSEAYATHEILNKIIEKQQEYIIKLEEIDKQLKNIENHAINYKKKEKESLRRKLLKEAKLLKEELKRINEITRTITKLEKKQIKLLMTSKYIKDPPKIQIQEIKIKPVTKTITKLPYGNYVARINDTTIISIYINRHNNIFYSKPKWDTTTNTYSTSNIHPRLKKELDQIKKDLGYK